MRLLLALLLLPACSGHCGSDAVVDAAATAPSAASSTQTTAAAVDAAVTKACSVGEVQVVDKAVRTDAGLTVVTLSDGRLAIGYATGKGDPAAVVVEEDGKATTLVVHADALSPAPAKPGTRVFQRITPLGFGDAGLDMHVALDVLDVQADKTQSIRCGPADDKPLASSADDPKTKDCRTFSDGMRRFALVSTASGDTVRWLLDSSTDAPPGADGLLYEAKYTADKLAQPGGRYLYQVPVAAFSPSGVVLASREDGGLVIARRDATLAPFGKAVRWWHGGAITMPALALREHDAAVLFSIQGQRDLYGSTFLLEAKDVPRPDKIALDDPSQPDGDRTSVTVTYSPKGNLLVGFADGKAGSRHARVAVLDGSLKTVVAPAEVATDVSELRVVAFPSGKELVLWIGTHDGVQSLQAAPLTCPE